MATSSSSEPRPPTQSPGAGRTSTCDADSPTPPFAGDCDHSHRSEAQTSFFMTQPADQAGPPPTPAREAAASAPPEVIDSLVSYRLGREIGRGGMGTVLEGRDTRLGREVAVKVLLETHAANTRLLEQFSEEVRILGQLQHPGIVPVYEAGQLPDRRPYFTMRLVKGHTLARLLAGRTGLEGRPHFLKVFEQVCQAMAYAHSKGVIHRDLKPQNVMVGDFGEVQVMDWGLARALAKGRDAQAGEGLPATACGCQDACDSRPGTTKGGVMGTPAYMSPEQAHGEVGRLDERTDVFGLGGILCEVLTGKPPYPGPDRQAVLARARRGDLGDTLTRLDACGADRDLVTLAKSCLAADPNDRPGDAGKLADAVTGHLESVLRRAERDLVRFFELSLDLFCIAGLDGYFRRVNCNFSRVLGHPSEELISRPFLDFVHPDDREGTLGEMAKLALGLPVTRFCNRYRDVEGQYRWFEWTAKAIPEEGVIFAVARDVTERVELEEQLRSRAQ
jgi:eukaryotic-like serine/threonine-protein kinase